VFGQKILFFSEFIWFFQIIFAKLLFPYAQDGKKKADEQARPQKNQSSFWYAL